MADHRTHRIDPGSSPDAVWAAVAAATRQACAEQHVALRDAVVLVPFAQLIDPARRAFSPQAGWQPRVETTDTWAASLGPPQPAHAGLMSGNAALDELTAAQMLRQQAGLQDWERSDPRGFAEATAATVATARAVHRAAHERLPSAREDFWAAALESCAAPGSSAPGGLERSLARVAVEWARLSPPPATDSLFEARPGVLVWVDAGGADPLAAALAANGIAATVHLDADPDVERPFDVAAALPPPTVTVVDSREEEARAVAGAAIEALRQGRGPVALIALDRALTRRVRAMLERRRVVVADETGWALSTTRAAAAVASLLKATGRTASQDDWLESLKSWPEALARAPALLQLEKLWRAEKPIDGTAAGELTCWARDTITDLSRPGRYGLQDWVATLKRTLQATGLRALLSDDPAGRQVLTALHVDGDIDGIGPMAQAMQAEVLDAGGFRAWVERTLERSNFLAPIPSVPDVVITPLARAMLRPFGAVVVGGADEQNLLAPTRHEGLLTPSAAAALGLPTPPSLLVRERLALAQVLRQPGVAFVRRRLDGAEILGESAALEAMALARRRLGHAALTETSPNQQVTEVGLMPVARPSPSAAGALPDQVSASTLESLRACPYRFFAGSVLRLKEADELDEAIGKREFGNWLHAVLDRFHRARAESIGQSGKEETQLHRAADEQSAVTPIASGRLLPYRMVFDALVPKYLAWMQACEVAGQHWQDGEFDADRSPPELQGMRLHGRIDRKDRGPDGTVVVDYKTGSVEKLKAQVRQPGEDTQLAFYALLMQADLDEASGFKAMYLALDAPDGPMEIEHKDVVRTARALLEGLANDLQRLKAGAGLPALGEGKSCDFCAARGLCRRDHWSIQA